MSFIVYDLVFLVLCTVSVVLFLSRHKKNLKRQGWVFLYHTKVGLHYMNVLSKKFGRILRPLQYVVITCGYFLLVSMTVLLVQTAYNYLTSPYLARAIKIPPLLPLFPYFPQLFKLDSIFPPFYFTYFLVALAIVAVSHEFAHGLFARLNNIRIKSTGLAFFGPFFGAFVEQDDRDMNKAKKMPQLAILAAGTFANVLMTILFGLILWGFFAASFVPAGINFNTYSTSVVNTSLIDSVNGISIHDLSEIATLNESLIPITSTNRTYLITGSALALAAQQHIPLVSVYEDAPALRARLVSPIVALNGQPTRSLEELRMRLAEHRPGDQITITTVQNGTRVDTSIVLDDRNGKSYLGIGVIKPSDKGVGGALRSIIYQVKDPFTYYESVWGSDFAWFVYNLLWWIVIINILVALFNMLPLGMLDGGRFFYLTIWGITGSERAGKRAFTIATWFFIGLLALMMVRWLFLFL